MLLKGYFKVFIKTLHKKNQKKTNSTNKINNKTNLPVSFEERTFEKATF